MPSEATIKPIHSFLMTPEACKNEGKAKVFRNNLDSIGPALKAQDEQKAEIDIPKLSKPSKKTSSDGVLNQYLEQLASALEAGFMSVAQSAEFQVEDQVNLQELDQTMSQQVELQSTESINQESQQIKLVKKIQNEKKHESRLARIAGDISSLGIGELLNLAGIHGTAARIISAVFMVAVAGGLIIATWGGAAPVAAVELGEDAALVAEMGEAIASDGGDAIAMDTLGSDTDSVSSSMSDTESDGDISSDEGEGHGGISDDDFDLDDNEVLSENEKQMEKAEDAAESDGKDEDNSINRKVAKKGWKYAKKLGSMAVGAVWGIPMILQGQASIVISGYKDDLSDVQSSIGSQLNTLKVNNGFFKFYQQLLQRGTTIAKETGNQMSEIVEIFGKITNSYKQVSNLLASQSA